MLDKDHTLFDETIIGGRPIAIYKLSKPLIYGKRHISYLELPAPKATSSYKEGFENIEFVVDCSLQEFMQKYADINFDTSVSIKL